MADSLSTTLAKAVAHPLRVRILTVLENTTSSPNQLAHELDAPLGNVSYHVKTLLEYECVELAKTEPRRGAVEHFYRSTHKVPIPGQGATLNPKQCKLAYEALTELLVDTEDTQNEEGVDAGGRSAKDREALFEIRDLLAKKAAKPKNEPVGA